MIHDLSDCRRSMVDGQYSLEVGTGLWILTYSGQRSAACPEAQRGIGGRRSAVAVGPVPLTTFYDEGKSSRRDAI
jgi:hypothetical protein